MSESGALLSVRELSVRYALGDGSTLPALDGVSLDLHAGETLGVLGESGSGKSSLALAIARLLPGHASLAGSIALAGQELTTSSPRQLAALRGASIGIVHQEPGVALNPVLSVGFQVEEVLRAHRGGPAASRRQAARDAFAAVGLEPALFDAYPHELSGGQRQRVVIAQAVVCGPSLLVADEPTTALDAVTQAGILALLADLRKRLSLALLLISHDPVVIAALADRVLVMYAGRVAEEGSLASVRARPLHPYTRALLAAARAQPVEKDGVRRLPSIPGSPPSPLALPPGCAFEPRCPDRIDACSARPPAETRPEAGHRVACVHHA